MTVDCKYGVITGANTFPENSKESLAVLRHLQKQMSETSVTFQRIALGRGESPEYYGKTKDKAVGRSRGGLNTKICTAVDSLGNPLYFQLSAGNVDDSSVAIDVLSHMDISKSNILGDKAYGTNEIPDYIQRQNSEHTISPKTNTVNSWHCDWALYKKRHLVECFFQKLKWFRLFYKQALAGPRNQSRQEACVFSGQS